MVRKQRGMTVSELAAAADISMATVSQTLNGLRVPKAKTLLKMGRVLGIEDERVMRAAFGTEKVDEEKAPPVRKESRAGIIQEIVHSVDCLPENMADVILKAEPQLWGMDLDFLVVLRTLMRPEIRIGR